VPKRCTGEGALGGVSIGRSVCDMLKLWRDIDGEGGVNVGMVCQHQHDDVFPQEERRK
jgi:hypothetical protein